MRILKDRHGFSYILTCAVILIMAMLTSVLVQYGEICHVIIEQKHGVENQLDNYLTERRILYFDEIKQGGSWDGIDRAQFVEGAYQCLSFFSEDTITRTENGKTVYTMSRPEIDAFMGNSVGLSVRYILTVPFEVFGRKVTDIQVTVRTVRQWTEK